MGRRWAGAGNSTVFEGIWSAAAFVHGVQSLGDPVDVGDFGVFEGAVHAPACERALIGLAELFDMFDEFAAATYCGRRCSSEPLRYDSASQDFAAKSVRCSDNTESSLCRFLEPR